MYNYGTRGGSVSKFKGCARLMAFLSLGAAFAGVFAVPARANTFTIQATFDSTITSDPHAALIENAINQTIGMYESVITTPVTVKIDYSEMSSGLGQSSTYYGVITYSQYLAALAAHSSGDAVDTAALASLPAGPNNPVNGSTNVDVTTATLRALGFNAVVATDSTISINTSITNYTGSTYNPSYYDLVSVIEHETDEALGLGSNLDNGVTTGDIRPEDLFRYSATGARSYSLSTSVSSYLSVNSGVTDLISFNQSGPPGGADYGDWAGSATPHVQDAYGTPGATPVWGVNEQTALDAIGYNFVSQTTTATPEPGTFWLLSLGVGAVGYGRARKFRRS